LGLKREGKVWTVVFQKQLVHDFALYQRSNLEPHASLEVLADSGYQGLRKLHEKSRTPRKKPRKSELPDEQKQDNRELARHRVVVEHVIRCLKIFRILAERYRNRRRGYAKTKLKSYYGVSRGHFYLYLKESDNRYYVPSDASTDSYYVS
jgi:DDE superfamily endonuclease